ncbi:hypothetical protein FQN49_006573, partial [Arthroderma sp. PD_2]
MKRKNGSIRKRASRQSLNLQTSANGQANGSMDSQIEMRKKGVSLESTSTLASRVMGQSNFSLDDAPPSTPQGPGAASTSFNDLPAPDKRNFLLLCVLYFLQGVPMGLAMGSVPFLLKPNLSYGQIGVFSL